jgi:hypothetical protein
MIDWKINRAKTRYMIGGGFYADSEVGRFMIEEIDGAWMLSVAGRWVGSYASPAAAKQAALVERLRLLAAIS